MAGGVHLTVDQQQMQQVYAALKEQQDGKKLKTALTKELKAVLLPAQAQAKQAILAMPTTNLSGPDDMRAAIANAVKISVRTTGRNTGVAVAAQKGKYPRGFADAPRAFNSAGWRHPVFGNKSVWVVQVARPGWFDQISKDKPEYLAAVESCLQAMADSIAARSHP